MSFTARHNVTGFRCARWHGHWSTSPVDAGIRRIRCAARNRPHLTNGVGFSPSLACDFLKPCLCGPDPLQPSFGVGGDLVDDDP
jgi:hypothetical protein